ncbi:MAG: FAD-dependent monooxygenase [Xanthomonadales bacterium]|nr:FAD-dependent monooxygenase [Xanthomonadales bacterium]
MSAGKISDKSMAGQRRIAVVGAGPAGQSAALALARAGYPVTLIDAGPGPAPAAQAADLRVFALSPASLSLLAELAVWPPPQPERISPYRRMHVWQQDPLRGLELDAAALGWSELGCIVEHGVLQHALAQGVASTPAIQCHWQARVQALDQGADEVIVQLEDGRRLSVSLLVAADGAGSPVRGLAGLTVRRHDYGQSGLVANVRCRQPHEGTARQRFLPTGPLAFLPLASGPCDCSIVWSQPHDQARHWRQAPAAHFEQALTAAMDGWLGPIELLGERALFPLARQLAERYHDNRVVLIADAAHAVHPLAGQGLNLGFLDVAALARILGAAARRDLDPGLSALLARYARERQGENALAAHGFDAIAGSYGLAGSGLDGLRDGVVGLLNTMPALKRQLVMVASGLAGR